MEVGGQSGLRKTKYLSNPLAHRTTWLRSDFSCAYNCPAKRPLVQTISLAKAKIKEMKKNGK